MTGGGRRDPPAWRIRDYPVDVVEYFDEWNGSLGVVELAKYVTSISDAPLIVAVVLFVATVVTGQKVVNLVNKEVNHRFSVRE